MIHVIAIITAKPGKRAAVLAEFHANVPNVLTEQGCMEYGPAIDAEGAGRVQTPVGADALVVVEKWESVEALQRHLQSPHMAAYAAKTRDLIAARVVHVLAPA